jgi:TPR repeat protein
LPAIVQFNQGGVSLGHSTETLNSAIKNASIWLTKADIQGQREAKATMQAIAEVVVIDKLLKLKAPLNDDDDLKKGGSDSGIDSSHERRSCRSYKVAADNGHADSQVVIAKCYLAPFDTKGEHAAGKGADYNPLDLITALRLGKRWLTKAASQGHAEAKQRLQDLEINYIKGSAFSKELDEGFDLNN